MKKQQKKEEKNGYDIAYTYIYIIHTQYTSSVKNDSERDTECQKLSGSVARSERDVGWQPLGRIPFVSLQRETERD